MCICMLILCGPITVIKELSAAWKCVTYYAANTVLSTSTSWQQNLNPCLFSLPSFLLFPPLPFSLPPSPSPPSLPLPLLPIQDVKDVTIFESKACRGVVIVFGRVIVKESCVCVCVCGWVGGRHISCTYTQYMDIQYEVTYPSTFRRKR